MNDKRETKPGSFGRLIRYLFHQYPVYLAVVMVCIIVSACASVVAAADR